MTAPAADVSDIQAFGIEAVLTFVLLLAIFAATDAARKHRGFEIPLAIGSAIVICHLVGVRRIEIYKLKNTHATARKNQTFPRGKCSPFGIGRANFAIESRLREHQLRL